MSTSKLALYRTLIFRNPRIQPLSTKLNNPFLFFKPPLHHHRHQTSFTAFSTSTAAAEEESLSSTVHPWPEWISFVDRLRAKGYLSKSADDNSVYSNINLLKDASLSFARDRYDVFKLLSSEDIQAVVEDGCPNFLRKAVNSAKRLRAHLRLDEGDVCSACNLRDSCDRAYVILKESEADARTVDIVRILLFYAIDPLVLSGGEKPPGREVIESSARKLLSQLIELSEWSPPPPPLPAYSKSTSQKDVSKVKPLSFKAAEMLSKNVEMKKGDWVCQKCNFMNFSRNRKCLNCEEDGPKSDDPRTFEMKEGDWICTECNFMNFSRNIACLECKTEGPKRVTKLRENSSERRPPRNGQSAMKEPLQSLRLKPPKQKISPAMTILQKYYGLDSSNSRDTSGETELAMYTSSTSDHSRDDWLPKPSPIPNHHSKSTNLPFDLLTGNDEVSDYMCFTDISDGGGDRSDEKSVRRRQKADVDNGGTTPERLFKEGNNSNGSNGSSSNGKTFSMRPKSASRASLFPESSDSGWLDSISVGLGDSIFVDGLSGVRKSSSASSLREQEKYNSAATAWPTISKPIFDGLPIPITGRRSKTALD